MSSKIDIRLIVSDHIATLRNAATDKLSLWDLILFFGGPVLLTGVVWKANLLLTLTAVNVLVPALAVFAGLLLNLLLLMHGIIRSSERADRSSDETTLLQQIYSNISYAILVALIALVVLLVAIVLAATCISTWATLLTTFLVAHFLLTLLMILKRVHILLAREFKR